MKLWEISLGKEPSLTNKLLKSIVDRRRLSVTLYKTPSLYLWVAKYKVIGVLVNEFAIQLNVLWIELCCSFKGSK